MAEVVSTHSLPPPFASCVGSDAPELIAQGAEAIIYRTTFLTPTTIIALKYRPSKSYRHPVLDRRLTRQRILAEARVLVRCQKEGLRVPAILALDWETGWIALEWVPGYSIRACLDSRLPTSREINSLEAGKTGVEFSEDLRNLMQRVGVAVGRLHNIGIVHGDLTTSNILLRQEEISRLDQTPQHLAGDIYLIDFGLAIQINQDEDRAVDLYVLERAFTATHPAAESLFIGSFLTAYAESFKKSKPVLKKLEEVRMRGRKRSMVG